MFNNFTLEQKDIKLLKPATGSEQPISPKKYQLNVCFILGSRPAYQASCLLINIANLNFKEQVFAQGQAQVFFASAIFRNDVL